MMDDLHLIEIVNYKFWNSLWNEITVHSVQNIIQLKSCPCTLKSLKISESGNMVPCDVGDC